MNSKNALKNLIIWTRETCGEEIEHEHCITYGKNIKHSHCMCHICAQPQNIFMIGDDGKIDYVRPLGLSEEDEKKSKWKYR